MKQDFKAFLKTTKGKLTVSCGALLLSWIFLLFQFSGNLSAWLPNETRKAAMNRDIRKYKAEQQAQQTKLKEIDALRKRYRNNIAGYWQVRRDGDPSVLLRQKVETAAKEVELSLENIGSVRTSNINNDLYFAEMEVSTSASFESIIRFLGKIRDLTPAVSWRRITLNLAFQRFRSASISRSFACWPCCSVLYLRISLFMAVFRASFGSHAERSPLNWRIRKIQLRRSALQETISFPLVVFRNALKSCFILHPPPERVSW